MTDNKRVFLAGSLSSLSACVALQPFDVIKTRIQEAPKRITIYRAIKNLEGPSQLWRGLGKCEADK